jgi:hypothetical protein
VIKRLLTIAPYRLCSLAMVLLGRGHPPFARATTALDLLLGAKGGHGQATKSSRESPNGP